MTLEELKLHGTGAGPKAAAALVVWLAVDGATDNLKYLVVNGGLGEAERAAIKSACPDGVEVR